VLQRLAGHPDRDLVGQLGLLLVEVFEREPAVVIGRVEIAELVEQLGRAMATIGGAGGAGSSSDRLSRRSRFALAFAALAISRSLLPKVLRCVATRISLNKERPDC
jgi:hypothetical protein